MDITALKAHLGDDLFSQVEEKLKDVNGLNIIKTDDGSWLPKSRLDEEIGKHKTTKDTVAALTKQLEEAKKAGATATALQATVDTLKQQLTERDGTIAGMKRSAKVQAALAKVNARDPGLVEKLLDASKIGEDDKGNLTGLDDQIKSLKESNGYLFAEDPGSKGGFGGGKGGTGNHSGSGSSGSGNNDFNNMIRAAAGRTVE